MSSKKLYKCDCGALYYQMYELLACQKDNHGIIPSPWKDLEKVQPNDGEEVLFHSPICGIWYGVYHDGHDNVHEGYKLPYFVSKGGFLDAEDVDYYMSIPDLPKAKK